MREHPRAERRRRNHNQSQSSLIYKRFAVIDFRSFQTSYLYRQAALKRLASAVQLRPWPPCFQSVSSVPNLNSVPFCSKKIPIQACRSLPRILGNFLRLNANPAERPGISPPTKPGRSRFHGQKPDAIVWPTGKVVAVSAGRNAGKADSEIRDVLARREAAPKECLR
jgi:hypothetical protein